MEIKNIKAKDFCCFGEFDLPVANNGLVWVSGVNNDSESASSNGSGKSSLFKALVWGLYSNTIDGEKGDGIIRAGAKKAVVTIELADKEGTWTIQRTRKKGSTKLDIFLPGGEAFKASTKDLQQKIIDMLGLDFLAFRNTVLYGQNDINRFTNSKTSDSDRKEMLHCILRSSIFSVCRDFASEDKKRLDYDIKDKETGIGQLEARISEYDLQALVDKSDFWKRDKLHTEANCLLRITNAEESLVIAQENADTSKAHPRVVADMKRDVEVLAKDSADLSAQSDEMETQLDVKLAELRAESESLRDVYRKINSEQANEQDLLQNEHESQEKILRDKYSALATKKNDAHVATAKFESKSKTAQKSLAKIVGDQCPVCNTSLQSSGVEEYRTELSEEKDQADDKCKKLDALIEKITLAMAKNADDILSLKAQTKLAAGAITSKKDTETERIGVLESELRKRTDKATRAGLEDIRSIRQDSKNKLIKSIEIKNELKLGAERVVAAQDKLSAAQDTVEVAKRSLIETNAKGNPFDELLEESKAKVDEHGDELKKLRKRVTALRKELAYAEFWNKGFSNQGVASYVLDSVMPYLTERANHYLEILADGDIKILFSTQKELKSSKNEYRDKIDITWMIEGQETSYPPSGGQAKKIEIATDLALMDLVTYREGHNTNILILDEVLDGLDDTGRQRVLQLLEEVNRYRNTVFVISHDSNISEAFESYITVEKNEGVSHIKHLSLPC